MKRLLYTILYVVLAASAPAQVKVTGRVIDLQNKPVSDVIVKLVSGTKTLAFTSSNAKGEYSLEVKSAPNGEVTLQFTHISYEKESERLTLGDKVTKLDMILTPKNISLKEVTVKPDPLRQKGDTLTHNLASFLGKGDVTLEDGLKRLPGVDVAQSGAISYMGKPISQFNIEGLDLLGGKYNQTTRNIPADYVTNVEIVRNHHSRRVERDVPSNEVSMNIKLSKKAKFKPFGQEEVGAGYMEDGNDRLQALLGVTGMMFTEKFQTICSLKGGNYKGFARADMIDHFGGSDVTTPATSLFGGFDGGAPPQGEYLFQRNGMATLNGIHKLDSATTVKVNADYSYHRATHDISQSSTYLSGDGSYVTVSEQTSPLTKVHLPKLTMNYLKNADRVYLSETFVLKGKFEQNEGDVVANGSLVEQRRRTSSFEVGNDLFWMGRTEKGTRRHVNASVSFRRTPTLRLSFVNDGQGYGQTAQSSTLTMNVGSSFNIPIGKTFRLSLPVRVNAMYDDLETYRVATGDRNDIRGWSFTPSVNPGFEIHSRNRRFYLSAGLGAALKGLYYNKLNYTKPVLNPSMGINYTFSANSKLQFSTGYTTQIGDMMTLLTEPMQVDYRTVRTSSGIIGESNTWHTSGDWKWQLPMQYFTLSLAQCPATRHPQPLHQLLRQQHKELPLALRQTRCRCHLRYWRQRAGHLLFGRYCRHHQDSLQQLQPPRQCRRHPRPLARTALRHPLRLVTLSLLRREQYHDLPHTQRSRPHLPHRHPRPLLRLRPCVPPDYHRSVQAHVPLQRLRAVQMEAVRPPPGTHQPPEPAQLRLHPLRRHQHLHLRLRPLRSHRNVENDIQIVKLKTTHDSHGDT